MEAKVPHRLRRRVASEVSAIFQASGLVEAKKLLAELSARWLNLSAKVRRLSFYTAFDPSSAEPCLPISVRHLLPLGLQKGAEVENDERFDDWLGCRGTDPGGRGA